MTNDGRLFIIDIIQQKLKDKVVLDIPKTDPAQKIEIVEAKLESAHNTLVIRTNEQKFYHVSNVISGISPLTQPNAFKTIKRLMEWGKDPKIEFTVVPKQESQSKRIELFITDPAEGFHYIKESDD